MAPTSPHVGLDLVGTRFEWGVLVVKSDTGLRRAGQLGPQIQRRSPSPQRCVQATAGGSCGDVACTVSMTTSLNGAAADGRLGSGGRDGVCRQRPEKIAG